MLFCLNKIKSKNVRDDSEIAKNKEIEINDRKKREKKNTKNKKIYLYLKKEEKRNEDLLIKLKWQAVVIDSTSRTNCKNSIVYATYVYTFL